MLFKFEALNRTEMIFWGKKIFLRDILKWPTYVYVEKS